MLLYVCDWLKKQVFFNRLVLVYISVSGYDVLENIPFLLWRNWKLLADYTSYKNGSRYLKIIIQEYTSKIKRTYDKLEKLGEE